MPPLSYVATAIILAALAAVSHHETGGVSVFLWYPLLAVPTCILAVAGVFKVAVGLGAPVWIGVVLALPGLVWANRLYEMIASKDLMATALGGLDICYTFDVAANLALLAAAAGALRLVEMMATQHAAFRVGYGLLAATALFSVIGVVADATGWISTNNVLYATAAQALGVSATIVKYGAFIGAAMVISVRRSVEFWTVQVITLIGTYMLYRAISSTSLVPLPGQRDLQMVWLLPFLMFVGGAAVWRMGSVLRAQAPERSVQSYLRSTSPWHLR